MPRVYIRAPIAERFWPKVLKTDGCWLWQAAKDKRGYGKIGLPGRDGWAFAHRVSYELHFGEIPEGLAVCHHCDTPECVRPDHLFIGTIADNNRDMSAKGRNPAQRNPGHRKGEGNAHAKLNSDQVREIRARFGKEPAKTLAAEYGIALAYVYMLANGKAWAHL